MKAQRVIPLGLIVGLTACAVGPNYHTPRPDAPARFVAAAGGAPSNAVPGTAAAGVDLAAWWRSLDDVELNSLVERAVKSNLDLQIALDRL